MTSVETCDSCGSPEPDLVTVHRIYLTPEAWDTEEKIEVVEELERWCAPCRFSYPHEVVDT
ncbi:MAG: hypothetical protein M3Z03_06845 [Actinomycetota bacterium]|nr:hypothetical protein [Actinomycetota bacterium]